MRKSIYILTAIACLYGAAPSMAQSAMQKRSLDSEANFYASDKTNIDFSETLIDGKMKAPNGFFLQGRQPQMMTQMVKLRSNFRGELRNSKSAVRATVK